MLSVKENYLRALRGEIPEYVPSGGGLMWSIRPSIFYGPRGRSSGKDIYGVEWTSEGSAIDAVLPSPGKYILDDIHKWRDVIKFPDFSNVDWETMAKKDLKDHSPDLPLGGRVEAQGFFQSVMSFMGFTEGLIACYEEPEEVKALINCLCDGYLSCADNYLKYYKPDFIMFADDIATERSPFVSLETFRDIFAPVWRRFIKYYKDRGYLAAHHNCGHFDLFIDDIVDMGYNSWDPAQSCNDLVGIKKKYGNRLMICGGFDGRAFLPHIDKTEEECRYAVKDLMDKLAPGGGYAFAGGIMGDDPVSKQRSAWIRDEYEKLKSTYYK